MNRLLCFTLLFSLLAFPASAQEALPQEPQVCHDTYTIRTPNMTYFESMRAGDKLVKAAAPEWYVEGTREMPVIMQASPNLLRDRYGEAWIDEEGVYHVVIGRKGLMLATIEDLASVILHEYVHVILWEAVKAEDWTEECKTARQELMANRVVIEHYLKLGYSPDIYNNSRKLYAKAKTKALLNQCPTEIMGDMPEVPMPLPKD